MKTSQFLQTLYLFITLLSCTNPILSSSKKAKDKKDRFAFLENHHPKPIFSIKTHKDKKLIVLCSDLEKLILTYLKPQDLALNRRLSRSFYQTIERINKMHFLLKVNNLNTSLNLFDKFKDQRIFKMLTINDKTIKTEKAILAYLDTKSLASFREVSKQCYKRIEAMDNNPALSKLYEQCYIKKIGGKIKQADLIAITDLVFLNKGLGSMFEDSKIVLFKSLVNAFGKKFLAYFYQKNPPCSYSYKKLRSLYQFVDTHKDKASYINKGANTISFTNLHVLDDYAFSIKCFMIYPHPKLLHALLNNYGQDNCFSEKILMGITSVLAIAYHKKIKILDQPSYPLKPHQILKMGGVLLWSSSEKYRLAEEVFYFLFKDNRTEQSDLAIKETKKLLSSFYKTAENKDVGKMIYSKMTEIIENLYKNSYLKLPIFTMLAMHFCPKIRS